MTTVRRPPNGSTAAWVKYLGSISSMLILVILVPVGSWLVLTTMNHGQRLSVIESNRFTSADALQVYRELAAKADKSGVPPPEVKQALARLERDVREIRHMIETVHGLSSNGRRERGSIGLDIIGDDDP